MVLPPMLSKGVLSLLKLEIGQERILRRTYSPNKLKLRVSRLWFRILLSNLKLSLVLVLN